MTCKEVRKQLSPYLDQEVSAAASAAVRSHLATCGECAESFRQLTRLTRQLHRTPHRIPTPYLRTSLRVIASKESQRRRRLVNYREGFRFLQGHLQLLFRNMLQPLAAPVAGGLVSAVFLFTLFLPAVSVPVRDFSNDVPTALTRSASVKSTAPFVYTENVVMVEIRVNDQGRIIDFTIENEALRNDAGVRLAIENALLFTQFQPATVFGQPTSGKVVLLFDSNQINVTG